MTVNRVALQASSAQLSALGLFADSNGLILAHAGKIVGSFTRDTSLATGTQAVTGVGFKPSAVIFLAMIDSTRQMSIGFDDGIAGRCIYDRQDVSGAYSPGTYSVILDQATGTINYLGYITSLDSDGFTMSWTKNGAKTGTTTIYFLAFR